MFTFRSFSEISFAKLSKLTFWPDKKIYIYNVWFLIAFNNDIFHFNFFRFCFQIQCGVKCAECSVKCAIQAGVQCAGCSMQRSVYSVQCTVYSVQCTVCSVQCAVCSIQFVVCSVQCEVCSVQCAALSVQNAMSSAQYALCSAMLRYLCSKVCIILLQYAVWLTLPPACHLQGQVCSLHNWTVQFSAVHCSKV